MNYAELGEQIVNNGFEFLPITFKHTSALVNLEVLHRDPFDRIIIAQALTDDLVVISRDSNFNNYTNLKLVW